ncbi:hypothetical protein Tco_0500893 [Tanacetum coccineum]
MNTSTVPPPPPPVNPSSHLTTIPQQQTPDSKVIDKMETNKSINRSDIQKNLYNALVEAYNSDKDIITSYGDVVTLKRGRDYQDKDEDPLAGSDRKTKRRKSSKDVEPSKGSKSKESKSSSSSKDTKMQQDQGNESGHIDEQPDNEAAPKHDWFQKLGKPPTPDHARNKSKSVDFRPPQKWISTIVKARQPSRTFDELIATPIDFLDYVMNRLKIDNLTQEILVGSAFNLLKVRVRKVFRKVFKKISFNQSKIQNLPESYPDET